PSGSLGNAPVKDGQNTNVGVQLTGGVGMPITPIVWPMLHSDTNNDNKYEYLMMPGVDLPIVYNGSIVTVSVSSGVIVPTIAPITPATTVPTIATTATATPTVSTTRTATQATADLTA